MKGLRFYDNYKLARHSCVYTERRPETLESEAKNFINHWRSSSQSVNMFVLVPYILIPIGVTQRATCTREDHWSWGTWQFIVDSKQGYTSSWWETLSYPLRSPAATQAWKMVSVKISQALIFFWHTKQDMQEQERHMEEYFSTILDTMVFWFVLEIIIAMSPILLYVLCIGSCT